MSWKDALSSSIVNSDINVRELEIPGVPFSYPRMIGDFIGTVNIREFCGAAPGTLLISGCAINHNFSRCTILFKLASSPWNDFSPAAINGEKAFREVDFDRIDRTS